MKYLTCNLRHQHKDTPAYPLFPTAHCPLHPLTRYAGSGEAHQRGVAGETLRRLASLGTQHASAISAIRTAHDALAAALANQRDALLREVDRAYDAKVADLNAILTCARSGLGELVTVGAAAEAALASSDPILKVRCHCVVDAPVAALSACVSLMLVVFS